MQNTLILFLVLFAGCGSQAPPEAEPQSRRTVVAEPNEARICLRTKTMSAGLQRWSVRTRFSATLEAGKSKTEPMTVLDGVEYRIESCGDHGVVDAVIKVVDRDGNIIAESSGSREPVVEFGPGTWGAVDLIVELKELRAAGMGAIAVAVEYRGPVEPARNKDKSGG